MEARMARRRMPVNGVAAPVTGAAGRYFFHFAEGHADGDGSLRDLLGGKGAGLADMAKAGIPVPPGFTITTETCRYYYAHGRTLPEDFEDAQLDALAALEEAAGRRLGDAKDP